MISCTSYFKLYRIVNTIPFSSNITGTAKAFKIIQTKDKKHSKSPSKNYVGYDMMKEVAFYKNIS